MRPAERASTTSSPSATTAEPVAAATLLLPPAGRFGGQQLSHASARRLGQANLVVSPVAGDAERLARIFDVLPRGWPAAAVTRQRDAGDAPGGMWLRADPVNVQPDINGARLMAHGVAMGLDDDDTAALLPALRPLFGDAGLLLDAPHPSRWYLRLPEGAKVPALASPEQALGEDLFEHLPTGGEGRRWRALLSESQVVLHNHPHNARRAAAGRAPVNSLWFWGAGRFPDRITTAFGFLHSQDDTVAAFAKAAGAGTASLPPAWAGVGEREEGSLLFDLRDIRDLRVFDHSWLAPVLADLDAGRLQWLTLDFADGKVFQFARRHRLRFWRRPRRRFAEPCVAGEPE